MNFHFNFLQTRHLRQVFPAWLVAFARPVLSAWTLENS
jgi:hypothetical protein